jgi:hypothetical protein
VQAKEVNLAGLMVSRSYDRLRPFFEHGHNENASRPDPEGFRAGGDVTLIEFGVITLETCKPTPGQSGPLMLRK